MAHLHANSSTGDIRKPTEIVCVGSTRGPELRRTESLPVSQTYIYWGRICNISKLATTINTHNFIMLSLQQTALATLALGAALVNAQTGTGQTTRYWDCCKPSCGWPGKAAVNSPVRSCARSGNPLTDMNARNGCESGGTAFMCTDQSPWAINDNLSYGFAAAKLAGLGESNWCCGCYESVSPYIVTASANRPP